MAKRAGHWHKAAKIATQTATRYVCVKTCKLMGGSLLDSLVEDDRVVSAIKAKKLLLLKTGKVSWIFIPKNIMILVIQFKKSEVEWVRT